MISVIVSVPLRNGATSAESRAPSEPGTPDTYVSSIHVTDGGAVSLDLHVDDPLQ